MNQRGDTLVEVIFALIILSAVLLGVMSLARVSRGNTQNSQQRTQAINLVQEQYEALRSYRDTNTYDVFTALTWVNAAWFGDPDCNAGDPEHSSCTFHMERDNRQDDPLNPGNPNPNFGKWTPCPGSFNPPLDGDTTWATTVPCSRPPGQSNITVGIDIRRGPSDCPNDAHPFVITATWNQTGLSSTGSTSLETLVGNVKNDPTSTVCP